MLQGDFKLAATNNIHSAFKRTAFDFRTCGVGGELRHAGGVQGLQFHCSVCFLYLAFSDISTVLQVNRPIILSMESLLAVSLSAQHPHQATGSAAPFQHANLANGLLQTTPPGFESPRNSASSKRKRQTDAEVEASSSSDSSSSDEGGSSSSSSTSGSEKVPKSQNDNQQNGAANIHAAPHPAEPTSPSGDVQASPETKKRKLMELQLQPSEPAVLTSPGAQQSSKPKQSAPSSGPRGRGLHIPKEVLHNDPSPLADSPKELSPIGDAILKPSPAADSKPKVLPCPVVTFSVHVKSIDAVQTRTSVYAPRIHSCLF